MVYHYTTDVTKEKRHHDKECYRAMIHHSLDPSLDVQLFGYKI